MQALKMLRMRRNSLGDEDAGEDGMNIKSFFKRRRKWQRLSLMLSTIAMNTTINGVYLDINKRGYISRSEKVSISYSLPDNVFNLQTTMNGFAHYIWSNKCKFVRAKNRNSSTKPPKRHNLVSKKIINKEENKEENEFSSITPSITLCKQEQDMDESDSSDGEDSSDDELVAGKRKKPRKRAPTCLSYLYSEIYMKKRGSKRHTTYMKHWLEDSILVPKIKSQHHPSSRNLYVNDHSHTSVKEDNDPAYNKKLIPLSFGDFFSLKLASKFGLQHPGCDSQMLHCIEEDNSDYSYISQLRESVIENVNYDLLEKKSPRHIINEDIINPEMPCNENSASDVCRPTSKHICEEDKADNLQETKQSDQNFPLIVLLSRAAIRPDNLRQDFKMNYKEAQCKPRRFVINVSHLVYQKFVLNVTEPLRIIPELDLSMYLVFSFIAEGKDDIDEYRVDINTTLPMNNQKTILAPLCQGEIASVHEIMHMAIEALEHIKICEIKKRKRVNLNDDINHKAIQSFSLLTVACKWNIQIMNCPHLLEWSDGSDSNCNLTCSSSCSDERKDGIFQNMIIPIDEVLSKQKKKASTCKQGPNKPYLCGICLKDFNENKLSFPIALYSCSHWFCESCWKASFRFQFSKIEHHCQLTCIEKGCTSLLDSTTLLSLLTVQDMRDHESWRWKTAIENMPQLKLCPNPSCRNIIFAKSDEDSNNIDQNINITCSCLFQKCLSCMSSPHWPVSCAVARIYHRRMDALNHDNFNRLLEDKELPALVLKGKSCPKCGNNLQVNFKYLGLKSCTCGCVICWSCGKEVDEIHKKLHASCNQNFEIEDKKLKQHLKRQDRTWIRNEEMSRWYKLALLHRQNRHPQIVNILYKMASHVAAAVGELSSKGKYVGNVKQAAAGWKSHYRKLAYERLKLLQAPTVIIHGVETYGSDIKDLIPLSPFEKNEDINDCINSPRSNSSMFCSPEPLQIDNHNRCDSYFQRNPNSHGNSMLKKAISNIVDTKLELHQIIEYTAILLEYSHTLHQPGKIIRCLERAEDMCTCLDMLIQPVHVEGSSRIVPSFLRIRTQIVNVLSSLQSCLKENVAYHSNEII